jgi:hypothetical protein
MFLAAAGLVATVASQSVGDLAACGQTCANNMVSAEKSQELGCDAGDIRCLCLNQNFIFGIRDCSLAICPGEDAQAALQYALDLCKGTGVAITTGGADGKSGTTVTEAPKTDGKASATVTLLSTVTDGTSVFVTPIGTTYVGGEGGKGTPIVSSYTSTITNSDGSAVSTVEGVVTVSDIAGKGSEIVSTFLSTVTNSDGSAISTVEGEVTLTEVVKSGSQIISSYVSTITNSDGSAVSTITGEKTIGGAVVPELSTFVSTITNSDGSAISTLTETQTVESKEASHVVSTVVGTTTNSNGDVITTTGTVTHKGSASHVLTTFTSEGSVIVSTLSTAIVPSGTEGSGSSESHAASTSSDNAAMAQMTAAPVGILAAAGVAFLLL